MITGEFLPLHKYIPQPPHRFPDIFFFHIGVVEYQDVLVLFFDFPAEFGEAGDVDVLLAGGPFDYGKTAVIRAETDKKEDSHGSLCNYRRFQRNRSKDGGKDMR